MYSTTFLFITLAFLLSRLCCAFPLDGDASSFYTLQSPRLIKRDPSDINGASGTGSFGILSGTDVVSLQSGGQGLPTVLETANLPEPTSSSGSTPTSIDPDAPPSSTVDLGAGASPTDFSGPVYSAAPNGLVPLTISTGVASNSGCIALVSSSGYLPLLAAGLSTFVVLQVFFL